MQLGFGILNICSLKASTWCAYTHTRPANYGGQPSSVHSRLQNCTSSRPSRFDYRGLNPLQQPTSIIEQRSTSLLSPLTLCVIFSVSGLDQPTGWKWAAAITTLFEGSKHVISHLNSSQNAQIDSDSAIQGEARGMI